jgi:xanthine dehydrogenase FAD-binding subunit
MPKLVRPETLDEALDALRAVGTVGADGEGAAVDGVPGGAIPYAGGTDLIVQWKRGGDSPAGVAVDLKRIDSLRRIAVEGGALFLGPCASLARVAADHLVKKHCPVLAEAASIVACPQVRNRATLGGNLCNASPAADTAVPLILSDALFEIRSASGRRDVPVCDFFTGPGKTVLEPGELLAGIRVPLDGRGGAPSKRVFSSYRKFGTRPAMEIAVVSVGAALAFDGGKVVRARIAFGSVAPTPLRGRGAEACLEGTSLDAAALETACRAAMEEVSPISDVRASAGYRRELTGILLGRILEDARKG